VTRLVHHWIDQWWILLRSQSISLSCVGLQSPTRNQMYWQVYNLLSRSNSKSGFHNCWALAINSAADYVIFSSQILLAHELIKDLQITFELTVD